MTFDAGDEVAVKKRNKKIKTQENIIDDDLVFVMSTAQGRRFVQRVMDESKMMASDIFTGNSSTFERLGRRAVGIWLYEEIMRVSPKEFISMMQEKLNNESENNG